MSKREAIEVNHVVVWKTVQEDLPALKPIVERLVEDERRKSGAGAD